MKQENSNKPKYEIIKEDILAQIRKNDFSYSEPLCTEKQLSEQYQVSRITAKHALTDLEQMGVLYRKRGVGSFVCSKCSQSSKPPYTAKVSPLKNGILSPSF